MEFQPQLPHLEHPKIVPPQLLEELHKAIEHFSQQKGHLERTMNGSEYRHEERVQRSRRQLEMAERELEDVTRKIDQELDKPA